MPRKLIFANSGVKLAAKGSDVLEHIREMEKKGIEIPSCEELCTISPKRLKNIIPK